MTAAHLERELKLAVPPAAEASLARAFEPGRRGVRRIDMSARYFDTAERDLARAGMALRVRRENDRWVQTLKAGGTDASVRAEYSVDRPDGTLDLEALAATPAAAVLARVDGAGALAMRYEVAIERLCLRRRVDGASLELAFDRGRIATASRSVPVLELEVELLRGAPAALFAEARRQQARHGLLLDPRSKAERGDALAEGRDPAAPRTAARVRLARGLSPQQALRQIAAECAAQVVRNAVPLGTGAGDARHVHELRIGLRRLRTAWRLFRDWGLEVPASLVDGARALFSALGPLRDRDVLGDDLLPALRRAGAPAEVVGGGRDSAQPGDRACFGADHAVAAIVSSPATQGWLLELLWWIEAHEGGATAPAAVAASARPPEAASESPAAAAPGQPEPPSRTAGTGPAPTGPGGPLKSRLRRRLSRWLAAVIAPAAAVQSMSPPERHALRKRIKRLRYAIEFSRDLLPRQWRGSCLPALVRVQRALGELNDLATARSHFVAMTAAAPPAWFAVGWIAAREKRQLRRAVRAMRALRTAAGNLA